MKNTNRNCTKLTCAFVVGVLIGHSQVALAGWTGTMNGTGFGTTTVNVRAADTSLLKTKYLTTTNMQDPSAAMKTTAGYVFGTSLPADASAATVARVKGSSGYVWQAETIGSDGDSTDHPELEARVKITAADCASLQLSSTAAINPDFKSGIITVNTKGTFGTALWVRGYEYTGDQSDLPEYTPPVYDEDGNLITPAYGSVEFLKTNVNSSLKWDILLVGPFDLDSANCNALIIPFTVETSIDHLYFIIDGVAKSLPLVIECPDDIPVSCGQPVVYPETVLVGGCGDIAVTFDPPAPAGGSFPPGSFPLGTNSVTVTATDTNGNTATCTFNVVVTGLTLKGFDAPISTQGNACETTTVTATKGNNVPIKFDMVCGTSFITTGPAPIVKIEEFTSNCVATLVEVTSPAEYQNDWHINWDTNATKKNFKYRVSVSLNGVELGYVWVKIK